MATVSRYTSFLFLVFAALVLSACASTPTPETPKQAMAATYVSIESIADTTLVAYQAGDIDRETVTKIYRKLQEAKSYVDLTAMTTRDTLTDADAGRLEQARAILMDLQKLLQEKADE